MLNLTKAVIAGAVLIAAPTVQAQTNPQAQAKEKAGAVLCASYESLAGQIMENRQVHVDLSKMMSLAESLDVSQENRAFIKGMIMSAYQSPAYESAEYQANAISEFKTKVSVACYQALIAAETK